MSKTLLHNTLLPHCYYTWRILSVYDVSANEVALTRQKMGGWRGWGWGGVRVNTSVASLSRLPREWLRETRWNISGWTNAAGQWAFAYIIGERELIFCMQLNLHATTSHVAQLYVASKLYWFDATRPGQSLYTHTRIQKSPPVITKVKVIYIWVPELVRLEMLNSHGCPFSDELTKSSQWLFRNQLFNCINLLGFFDSIVLLALGCTT